MSDGASVAWSAATIGEVLSDWAKSLIS
jgi:hypothetical protein